MDAFEVTDLIAERKQAHQSYLEFLRPPGASLSVGLYVLPAGGVDLQRPHTEDEVYYAVGGRAVIRVGAEDRAVSAGSIVYVKAMDEHRFHTITEELTLLVFFAPAEHSRSTDASSGLNGVFF